MTPPLFLVDAFPAGDATVLAGDEARHAATVRRVRVGEELLLGDGAGSLARCTVIDVRTGRSAEVELDIEQRWLEPAPELRVTVAQALVKGDRGRLAVELATEAGADHIVGWRAERCVARWEDGQRGAKALARWRGTARAAAKQARRAWVPHITAPIHTPALGEMISRADVALVLDSAGGTALRDVALPAAGELVLVVGPEGGITPAELDILVSAGAIPTRMGQSVLRASTAAAVALGALGALSSRWP